MFESIDEEDDDMVENLESLDRQPGEIGFDYFKKECKTSTITSEKLRTKLHLPPNKTNLVWEPKVNYGRGRPKDVYTTFIPWNKVLDHVEGESNIQDFPCMFLEVPRKVFTLGFAINPKTTM